MSAFLHKARPGHCRFILCYRPAGITFRGPVHRLPVVCDETVSRIGSSWCDRHAKGMTDTSRAMPKIPEDRRSRPAPPRDDRTPALDEVMA